MNQETIVVNAGLPTECIIPANGKSAIRNTKKISRDEQGLPPLNGTPLTKDQVLELIEDLDDFARMNVGVDPSRITNAIKRYIEISANWVGGADNYTKRRAKLIAIPDENLEEQRGTVIGEVTTLSGGFYYVFECDAPDFTMWFALRERVIFETEENSKLNPSINRPLDEKIMNPKTKLIPILIMTDQDGSNADCFMSNLSPKHISSVLIDNKLYNSAPLKVGKEIDLLGISQDNRLLNNGTMDYTDTIDPKCFIKHIHIRFSSDGVNDVFKVNTSSFDSMKFYPKENNNPRILFLNNELNTIAITISFEEIKKQPVLASILLPLLPTGYTDDIVISTIPNGHLHTDLGNTLVVFSYTTVYYKVPIDTDGAFNLVQFAAAPSSEIVGYELAVDRVNNNRK